MIPHLEAVATLACRHARVYLGDRHDRFRSDTSWQAQVEASVEVMSLLTPRLLDLGLRLAIETHADLTVFELLNVLDRLDPRAFGVTLDTGNLVMRLDDPIDAVRPVWRREFSAPTSRMPYSPSPRAGFAGRRGRSDRASCR